MKQSWWADYRQQLLRANTLRRALEEELARRQHAEKWAGIYFGVVVFLVFVCVLLAAGWLNHMQQVH